MNDLPMWMTDMPHANLGGNLWVWWDRVEHKVCFYDFSNDEGDLSLSVREFERMITWARDVHALRGVQGLRSKA